jgi:hypothetical protein
MIFDRGQPCFQSEDDRRCRDLTAELRRAVERELSTDPTNPAHVFICLRALARCVGPALASGEEGAFRFWFSEIDAARISAHGLGAEASAVPVPRDPARRRP